MDDVQLSKTTIGKDYLNGNTGYPTDLYLEYLYGIMKMRSEQLENEVWQEKYTSEIEAIKEILRRQAR